MTQLFHPTQTGRGQAVNLEAPGSTPGDGAKYIPSSSNGKTTASDSVNSGSIPLLVAGPCEERTSETHGYFHGSDPSPWAPKNYAGVVLVVTRLASTQKLRVRFSLPAPHGPVVKWHNSCLVSRVSRFDSELGLQMVPSSGGGQRLQPVGAQFNSVRNLQDLCVGERQLQFPKSRMAGGKPKGH